MGFQVWQLLSFPQGLQVRLHRGRDVGEVSVHLQGLLPAEEALDAGHLHGRRIAEDSHPKQVSAWNVPCQVAFFIECALMYLFCIY